MLEMKIKSEKADVAPTPGGKELEGVFVFPAGLEQSRYWILDQLGGASTASNMAIAFRLDGPVGDTLVERSLRELVLRHEALRTTYRMIDGELAQIISEEPHFAFSVSDLRALASGEALKKAEELILEHGRVRIDLDRGPVVHARLIHISDSSHFLAYTIHHIACDGWSNGILVRDFTAIYAALEAGRDPALPALPFQFADFTVWQKQWLESPAAQAALDFWRENLRRDMPAVDLPTDRPRGAQKSAPGHIESTLLSPDLAAALKQYCRRHGATMHQALLAAFEGFLSRYTGQTEFLLGSTIANRTQPGMENVVGRFANPQVIPADVHGDPSFHELVERVSSWSARSYTHQDLSFSRLMEEFQLDQDGAASRFLEVYFVYQKAFMQPQQAGGLTVTPRPSVSGGVNFDFLVSVVERAEGPRLQVEYNTRLFTWQRVRRFIAMFVRVLEAVMADDAARVSEWPLVEPGELAEVQAAGSSTWQPGSLSKTETASVWSYLDRKMAARGSATAIVSGGNRTSWADLRKRSLEFASRMAASGVEAGRLVALEMNQTAESAAAALAALRLGAAVLPVPAAASAADWVELTACFHPALSVAGSSFAKPPITSFSELGDVPGQIGPDLPPFPAPESPAWLNPRWDSASGKGRWAAAEISHRDALRSIAYVVEKLDLGNRDVIAIWPAASSPDAWTDLMLWLVSGATLIDRRTLPAAELATVFEKEQVTAAIATPAEFVDLLSPNRNPDRRVALVCRGAYAALAASSVERLIWPRKVQVIYSTTSGAGPVALGRLITDEELDQSRGTDGGEPRLVITLIGGSTISIVDRTGLPVPFGVPGELVIDGHRDRHEDQRQTDESRLGETGHTGLIVRFSPERGLEPVGHLGRAAQMHGNRGYRLHLEDLEDLFYRHPGVAEVEAALVEHNPGGHGTANSVLTAFVVLRDGSRISADELRSFLAAEAPPHLAEAEIVVVGRIPRRPDGSINTGNIDAASIDAGGSSLTAIRSSSASQPAAQPAAVSVVPPRDKVERELVRIWEDTLGKKGLGIHDSFFSLGGYSLMIVRLFARINRHFSKSLPITTIFNAPTIAELAEILRGRACYSKLVPVQTKGSEPPLFLLLSYLLYDGLRSALGDEQPIYGLRELGNETGMKVEEQAAGYVREIRKISPHGPYRLAGWCAAGSMTVETARQLTQEGEAVSSLILFDSWRPGYAEELAGRQKSSSQSSMRATLKRKLRYQRMCLAPLSGAQRAAYIAKAVFAKLGSLRDHFYLRHWRLAQKTFARFGLPLPGFMHNVSRETLDVVQNFRGQPYSGRITLIRATEAPYVPGCEPACGWDRIAKGGVNVVFTPGTHESMFLGSNLGKLGDLLRAALSNGSPAEARQSSGRAETSYAASGSASQRHIAARSGNQ